MTSTVSVVMGTYNGERYVEEQLRSILDQTLRPAEVIVADDGSTDRTLEIVEGLRTQTEVPIRVIRNPTRLGFADNFLSAAGTATGDLIAFSDQDDRWRPTKLEAGAAALLRHDAVYCTHAVSLMDEGGRDLGRLAQAVPQDTTVPPRTANPWDARFGFSVMVDRSLLDAVPAAERGPDTYAREKVLSHDRWAYALAWSLGRAVHLSTPLASYRQHAAQLYGHVATLTLRNRIALKAATGEERIAFLMDIAGLRRRLFQEAEPDRRTRVAATAWARLHVVYRNRVRLYREPRAGVRLLRLLSLALHGTYRSFGRGGVGSKAVVEDLTFGLVGPRVRRRLAGSGR